MVLVFRRTAPYLNELLESIVAASLVPLVRRCLLVWLNLKFLLVHCDSEAAGPFIWVVVGLLTEPEQTTSGSSMKLGLFLFVRLIASVKCCAVVNLVSLCINKSDPSIPPT